MESARRFGRVFSEFRSVLCPVITHSNLKLSAPDLSKNSRYASVRSRLEARLKFRHLFGSNRFRCTSRFRQWYESWMLAYPSVTTPNLYSDPSLWSVSHCSNLERTSGKASALSTVSFQTERKKKKQNGFEVPITSCNLITTKALKKRFVYREAPHWTLNSRFVVKDVIFIFPERGTKKQIWALDKIQTQTSQIPVGCSWHAYCILPGSAMPRVYRVEFRPPRKSTTLQDGYPE